jgi:pimeloyl-ACP methyl ester carboxylesterase
LFTQKLRSQYTKIGDLFLHARISTEGLTQETPAIVLVHGLVVSSRNMVPVAELLASDYRVYALDFPGYGESDKPNKPLTLANLANYLYEWMDANHLDRAILLGNSFGCQIIAEFALRYCDRIDRAILQGPSIDRHARTLPQQIWRLLQDEPYENPSQFPLQLYDFWLAGLDGVLHTLDLALSDRIEEKLPYLRVPTLVVRGKKDTLVPQRWAQEVVERLPNAKLVVIPGGGHTLNYTMPLELARVTKAFIEDTQTLTEPKLSA